MNREKRLATYLAAGFGVLLLICTIASQLIYWRLLPRVQAVDGYWQEDAFILPKEALFTSTQGDCVYYIEEKPGRFGSKYLARAVLVTVVDEDAAEGAVAVRGIYNPEWRFAANADSPLSDGVEVKIE